MTPRTIDVGRQLTAESRKRVLLCFQDFEIFALCYEDFAKSGNLSC